MVRSAPDREKTIMTYSTRNTGDPWTADDIKTLRELVAANTPTRVIGLKLGRTEEAIYAKAKELGLSLKPTNQSPYGTKYRRRRQSRRAGALGLSIRGHARRVRRREHQALQGWDAAAPRAPPIFVSPRRNRSRSRFPFRGIQFF